MILMQFCNLENTKIEATKMLKGLIRSFTKKKYFEPLTCLLKNNHFHSTSLVQSKFLLI